MSLIGVLNSDQSLNLTIGKAIETGDALHHLVRYFDEEEKIAEFLNFDLPEIVILNAADPSLRIQSLIERMRGESWLHNFGIICLFDRSRQKEEEILEEVREINVLTLLDQSRIATHLHKIIHIIEENWQIIFQQDITEKLVKKSAGAFLIDNDPLAIRVYAGLAATSLQQRGLISDEQRTRLQLALAELILNGIEHGHCGIGMQEKESCLLSGGSMIELIQEKSTDPAVAKKRIRFEWETKEDATAFTIRDQGEGFDVAALQRRLNAGGPETVNGRGILMAMRVSRRLSFNRKGNVVRLVFAHSSDTERSTPAGFGGHRGSGDGHRASRGYRLRGRGEQRLPLLYRLRSLRASSTADAK